VAEAAYAIWEREPGQLRRIHSPDFTVLSGREIQHYPLRDVGRTLIVGVRDERVFHMSSPTSHNETLIVRRLLRLFHDDKGFLRVV